MSRRTKQADPYTGKVHAVQEAVKDSAERPEEIREEVD